MGKEKAREAVPARALEIIFLWTTCDEWEELTPTIGGVYPPEQADAETDKDEGAAADEDGQHICLFDGWRA